MVDDIQLDMIAVAAHPDDCEIGCGGTLAKAAKQGYKVGIIDLTDGEPTPRSPAPEVRLSEAKKASEILRLAARETLSLPNRRLFDTFENRLELARALRKYRPKVVVSIGGKTTMASPDHYQGMLIVEAAAFYCKLTKWEEYFDPYPPCPVPRIVYWPTRHVDLGLLQNSFVVDISDTIETKLASVLAYESQFPPGSQRIVDWIKASARLHGVQAGFEYGELFWTPGVQSTDDIMRFLKLA